VTTLLTEIAPPPVATPHEPADLYVSRGSSVEQPGWTVLEFKTARKSTTSAPTIPGGLAEGDAQTVANVEVQSKQTQPPKPYTEATLLTAMETAGRSSTIRR
jgi:DNA topoisomerase-3